MVYSAWVKQKQQANSAKSWIKVNLSNRMKERQYWIKKDNHWKIIYEGAA